MSGPGDDRNPLLDGLRIEPTPEPTALVIFGASGDLTRRKLLPAVYHLSRGQRLPARFNVIGVAPHADDRRRVPRSSSTTASRSSPASTKPDEVVDRAGARPRLRPGRDGRPGALRAARGQAGRDATAPTACSSTSPSRPTVYGTVVEQLSAAGPDDAGRRRTAGAGSSSRSRSAPISTSARELNRLLHTHLDESQIFRIDHYLGKETVQNLLVFRFANGMFEPVWNRRYIDHVQITAAETVGVERRAGYYEGAGALRDMVQNHLMQVLALIAMEPPIAFSAENVRDRKHDVLASIQPILDGDGDDSVVRAQYAAGWVSGAEVPGYREEDGRQRRSRRPRPTSRCGCSSTAGAGPACRSTCAPASGCRSAPPRSRSSSGEPPLHIFKRISPTVDRAEPADRQRAARRRHLGALRGQAAGQPHAARAGDDELPLRQRVRHAGARGLRDAAARRDARRSDAVRAPRLRRGVVGADHARSTRRGRRPARRSCRPTRRASGARPRPTR